MAHVSHKLKTAVEGALAGGGDPATSPLYVFGPFLKLIVVAGVAEVTFGASVWMVILTIAVVSAMYRLVMRWVIDGSGGSGLSEEEFGGWAVKVNAAITFIEYTLTFLVSMSAMVTFIADRIPLLNNQFLWMQYRTVLAIALSILTGWLVNRGPKVAARAFGPATGGVLLLLWAMVFATVVELGFHLPKLDFQAFQSGFIGFTINGYARILAVMTGIEVFANLVAAYDGEPAQKSKKAFTSLLIIMGTTGITMLIVGPAIFQLSDPTNESVSVFTQTMDKLLPEPLPWLGTLIGVAVLMSASAASAQGLQNLALGLYERNYIPRYMGERNTFEVATGLAGGRHRQHLLCIIWDARGNLSGNLCCRCVHPVEHDRLGGYKTPDPPVTREVRNWYCIPDWRDDRCSITDHRLHGNHLRGTLSRRRVDLFHFYPDFVCDLFVFPAAYG